MSGVRSGTMSAVTNGRPGWRIGSRSPPDAAAGASDHRYLRTQSIDFHRLSFVCVIAGSAQTVEGHTCGFAGPGPRGVSAAGLGWLDRYIGSVGRGEHLFPSSSPRLVESVRLNLVPSEASRHWKCRSSALAVSTHMRAKPPTDASGGVTCSYTPGQTCRTGRGGHAAPTRARLAPSRRDRPGKHSAAPPRRWVVRPGSGLTAWGRWVQTGVGAVGGPT